jgi:hypothetical protein
MYLAFFGSDDEDTNTKTGCGDEAGDSAHEISEGFERR